MDKQDLRKKMIAIRKNIPAPERTHASRLIVQKVLMLQQWQQAETVCLYESLPTEVDTKELFAEARVQKKTVVVPPAAGADLFIVPGVAFDSKGNRLGRGMGYYDSLLANVTVPKIGLAFACQLVAKIPRASYDVPMTMVITEK